jgi:hypothetical protein
MHKKVLALILICLAVPLAAWGLVPRAGFKAQLSGAESVPPVKTEATGGALFDFSEDGKAMHFTLSVKNLNDVIAAHLHLGAKGKEGPPVATLYPFGNSPPVKAGAFSGILVRGVITGTSLEGPLKGKPLNDLLKEFQEGNAYIKVHTKSHPDGEMRGQIVRRPA